MHSYKKFLIKICTCILICSFLLPVHGNAATFSVTPRASDYLDSYNAYICPMALGKIHVWFSVTADDYMDDIGTLTIQIYESTDNQTWTWVKTYKHSTTSVMLAHDDIFYSNYVEYNGIIGRYYKAYVTIWAGKDGGGDTRYMWTQPKKATLLAS